MASFDIKTATMEELKKKEKSKPLVVWIAVPRFAKRTMDARFTT